MIDGRPDAALSLRHVASRRLQEIQVRGNLVGDLGQWQHACPGRGQFQRQRHPVDQASDARHVGIVRTGHTHAGTLGGPHEETHRAEILHRLGQPVPRDVDRRHPHPGDLQRPLAAQPQSLA